MFFIWGPPTRITTPCPLLATRHIYTRMCTLPQWHGATKLALDGDLTNRMAQRHHLWKSLVLSLMEISQAKNID